jgi:erythromycin esterase-like protein
MLTAYVALLTTLFPEVFQMISRTQTKFCVFVILISTCAVFAQTPQNLDLTRLDAIVGNKKYVNVGEDSHFMVEVHKFIARAFPYLVEKKGFRVFVFESAWGIDDKFQDFMNSDRTTVK